MRGTAGSREGIFLDVRQDLLPLIDPDPVRVDFVALRGLRAGLTAENPGQLGSISPKSREGVMDEGPDDMGGVMPPGRDFEAQGQRSRREVFVGLRGEQGTAHALRVSGQHGATFPVEEEIVEIWSQAVMEGTVVPIPRFAGRNG